MTTRLLLLSLLCLVLITPATAQILYDNGAVNGTVDAWTISNGYVVSDTFYLPQPNTTSGISFWAWIYPGDTLYSAEVSITSSANGGTVYFNEVLSAFQANCFSNPNGYSVCAESLAIGGNGLALNSGTYWVNLFNASATGGDPVYWDENSGVGCQSQGCPSQAYDSSAGTIPSEAFSLYGGTATSSSGSTPEPRSIFLFASGIVGMAGWLATLSAALAKTTGSFPDVS
jgi:hypothetical protein